MSSSKLKPESLTYLRTSAATGILYSKGITLGYVVAGAVLV
nr:MAG TPA: hypothetical protein [Crassvirales sp.]